MLQTEEKQKISDILPIPIQFKINSKVDFQSFGVLILIFCMYGLKLRKAVFTYYLSFEQYPRAILYCSCRQFCNHASDFSYGEVPIAQAALHCKIYWLPLLAFFFAFSAMPGNG